MLPSGQGGEDATDEARQVAQLTVEEATRQMAEAQAIRVVDALASSNAMKPSAIA